MSVATNILIARSPARRRVASRAGFTLLELILALGMVAILAGSLYASMRIAFRAKASAETAIEPSRTADMAFELLRNDLQNALPPNGVIVGTFEGADSQDDRGHDGDDVQFYTTAEAPDHAVCNSDVKFVELSILVPDGMTDHCLVRQVTRNLLTQVQPTPDQEIICRGVYAFSVQYYGGTDLGWLDSWDSTQQDNVLPSAVKVTISLERPDTNDRTRILNFTRVYAMACSTAATDDSLDATGGT